MTSNKLTAQKALFVSQGVTPVAASVLEGHKLNLAKDWINMQPLDGTDSVDDIF